MAKVVGEKTPEPVTPVTLSSPLVGTKAMWYEQRMKSLCTGALLALVAHLQQAAKQQQLLCLERSEGRKAHVSEATGFSVPATFASCSSPCSATVFSSPGFLKVSHAA